jgi:uncharacterized phage-associated protein
MKTCFDVANYFLKRQDPDAGDLMSNLKLQKLVYYAQGFHLAMENSPLFNEPIEAWEHGPVCVPLYHKYKSWGSDAIPIPCDTDAPCVFNNGTNEVLDLVYMNYGQFSAWKLRDLTHEDVPWVKAYARNPSEITCDEMKTYFKTQLIDYDNDTDYLNSIPGMMESITESINSPPSEWERVPEELFHV